MKLWSTGHVQWLGELNQSGRERDQNFEKKTELSARSKIIAGWQFSQKTSYADRQNFKGFPERSPIRRRLNPTANFAIAPISDFPIYSIPRFYRFPDSVNFLMFPTKFDGSADRIPAEFRRRPANADFADS